MKKKLIAVAVAGALVAPAMAMAQASKVQLYGRASLEYAYAHQGKGRPNTDILQNGDGPALGFRGEEKLGGGLAAWFQCESNMDVRGISQSGFCGRNSAIGFKGAFGNFHFGNWDTPFKLANNEGLLDLFAVSGVAGGNFLLTGASATTAAAGGQGNSKQLARLVFSRREASMVYYESPTFSGLRVLAGYSSADATAVTNSTVAAKPRVLSIAGIYKNGPLGVNTAYESHNNFGTAGGVNDDRAWEVGAFYQFGPVKVSGEYVDIRYEATATSDVKKRNFQVGADWHVTGPHFFDFIWTSAGKSRGNATAVEVAAARLSTTNAAIAAPGSGTGGDLYQVAYKHQFSKRTATRLSYVWLNNDRNAIYSLGGLATQTTPGVNQNAIRLQMNHAF